MLNVYKPISNCLLHYLLGPYVKDMYLMKTLSFPLITHLMLYKYLSLEFTELTWKLIHFEFKHLPKNFNQQTDTTEKLQVFLKHILDLICLRNIFFSLWKY